jgi:hypothetical protein
VRFRLVAAPLVSPMVFNAPDDRFMKLGLVCKALFVCNSHATVHLGVMYREVDVLLREVAALRSLVISSLAHLLLFTGN